MPIANSHTNALAGWSVGGPVSRRSGHFRPTLRPAGSRPPVALLLGLTAVLALFGCSAPEQPATPPDGAPETAQSAQSDPPTDTAADTAAPDAAPTDEESTTPASAAEPVIETVSPEAFAERVRAHAEAPLVINFWATWCAPCIAEMPELVAFHKTASDEGIGFLSAAILSDIEDGVRPLLRDLDAAFPVYSIDTADPEALVAALPFETDWDGALPATFLLNGEGELVQTWYEEVTEEILLEAARAAVP